MGSIRPGLPGGGRTLQQTFAPHRKPQTGYNRRKMKNTGKTLVRKVEYKQGKNWLKKVVRMEVQDYQDGLELLDKVLNREHGKDWRYVTT
jgi:hypothetical protein